jgi:hypothetical protein
MGGRFAKTTLLPVKGAMTTILRCHPRVHLGYQEGRSLGLSRTVDVLDENGEAVHQFDLMCAAIDQDIESAEGSGSDFLEVIRRIEAGEVERIEADGNAWVAHITRDKVWFEGLYNQGKGGEVSFAQYKLAVQTYVRFLADPERKPIEVEFPPE